MDRSLDEIIAERPRQNRGGGRGRGRRGNHPRDGVKKVQSNRHLPSLIEIEPDRAVALQSYKEDRVDLDRDWVHDKFEDDKDTRPARGSRPRRGDRYSPEPDHGPTGAKIRVENLHYDLTEDDLEDLFTRIGPVPDLSLRYDRAGRSEGVAFVTYSRLSDARTAIREFDGANAKGQPIRLTLLPSGGNRRNPFENVEKPKGSLFDRIERPRDRAERSLSPESINGSPDGGARRRRRGGGRVRHSDVSKPPPDHIDRYVPGQRSPERRNGGGRRPGQRRDETKRTDSSNRRTANGRPRKTQDELDQEMEDYWGSVNAGAVTADKAIVPDEPPQIAPPSTAAAGDDDIDMIE